MKVELFVPAASRSADGYVNAQLAFIFCSTTQVYALQDKLRNMDITSTYEKVHDTLYIQVPQHLVLNELPDVTIDKLFVGNTQAHAVDTNCTFAELADFARKTASRSQMLKASL